MSEGNVSYFYIDLERQLVSALESVDVWARHHGETRGNWTNPAGNQPQEALKMDFISLLSASSSGSDGGLFFPQ